MTRVHIGEKSGRIGAWISAPGQDASSEGDRMLLNSDFDNLKFHYADRRLVSGGDYNPTYDYYQGASLADPIFSFTALPFVPLAFMTISRQISDYTLAFPPGSGYRPGASAGLEFIPTPKFTVFNNRVVVDNSFDIWDSTMWCYVWVFANPIEGL